MCWGGELGANTISGEWEYLPDKDNDEIQDSELARFINQVESCVQAYRIPFERNNTIFYGK